MTTSRNAEQDHVIKDTSVPNGIVLTNGLPRPSEGPIPEAEAGETTLAAGATKDYLDSINNVDTESNGTGTLQQSNIGNPESTEARFDALAREREALRDEVTELRKSLEQLQARHEEDLSDVKSQLEETRGEKDHAETQYRNLLGKVNTIKSQLGDRLRADAVSLGLSHCIFTLILHRKNFPKPGEG